MKNFILQTINEIEDETMPPGYFYRQIIKDIMAEEKPKETPEGYEWRECDERGYLVEEKAG